MAKDALIGATGFVGGLLSQSHEFSHQYNSKNGNQLAGEVFSTVYCAALPGVKWRANQEPWHDIFFVNRLIEQLNKLDHVENFVLISTVDVYLTTDIVFETDAINQLNPNSTYGINRRILELFVQSRFPNALIVRLPAIIGKEAFKGPLYDIKKERVEDLRADSVFQWYPGERIYEDSQRLLKSGVKLANLVTPPISLSDLCVQFGRPHLIQKMNGTRHQHYDVRTIHSFESQPYTRAFPAKEIAEYLAS